LLIIGIDCEKTLISDFLDRISSERTLSHSLTRDVVVVVRHTLKIKWKRLGHNYGIRTNDMLINCHTQENFFIFASNIFTLHQLLPVHIHFVVVSINFRLHF
jgi:hypothetical protein